MFLDFIFCFYIKALLLLQPFLRGKKNIGFPLQLLSCGKATYLRWQVVWWVILSCMVGSASLDSVCLWWPYWLVRALTLLWHWRTVLILTIVKQLVWWVTSLRIAFVWITTFLFMSHTCLCWDILWFPKLLVSVIYSRCFFIVHFAFLWIAWWQL